MGYAMNKVLSGFNADPRTESLHRAFNETVRVL